jgi:hypothetical protein
VYTNIAIATTIAVLLAIPAKVARGFDTFTRRIITILFKVAVYMRVSTGGNFTGLQLIIAILSRVAIIIGGATLNTRAFITILFHRTLCRGRTTV